MFEQVAKALKEAGSVAVLAHISEDADALGSAFAMAEILRDMGKTAVCYLSDVPEKRLAFISDDFVVYEEGMQAAHDLCICLDSGSIDRLGARIAMFDAAQCTVNIDHHCTNTNYAQINCVDGGAAATGEILFALCKELCIPLTAAIARYLYIAIASDTGCFKYSSVKPETMRAAAELLEFDIDHAALCRQLFDADELNIVQFEGWIRSRIKSYYGGKLCIVSAGQEDFARFGAEERDVGDIVNIPRSVKGTEIAVSIRKLADKTKISFRSNGTYNVADLALQFGGGGHVMAAGATVAPGDDIEERVIKACGELFHD